MKTLHIVAFILVIVGGLNWLLVGIFGWDIGILFGGQGAMVSKLIYILVGLSAIYLLLSHKKDCKHCSASMPASASSTPNTPASSPM